MPYISTADYIINSGMPYELPVYRPKLLDYFEKWSRDYKDDPLRQDAYVRSKRVYTLLKTLSPVADDSIVPTDSVLREFIGGLDLTGRK